MGEESPQLPLLHLRLSVKKLWYAIISDNCHPQYLFISLLRVLPKRLHLLFSTFWLFTVQCNRYRNCTVKYMHRLEFTNNCSFTYTRCSCLIKMSAFPSNVVMSQINITSCYVSSSSLLYCNCMGDAGFF